MVVIGRVWKDYSSLVFSVERGWNKQCRNAEPEAKHTYFLLLVRHPRELSAPASPKRQREEQKADEV